MDIIRLLPDSVANQIAAGEVIQRPASVVKELLENAIDAEAKEILLIVKESGKKRIEVIDDGNGMTEADARMAFERHATSKIQGADDLFKIRTKGFRGEALASIAAVAQVELQTRHQEREVGTELDIEGSRVLRQEASSHSNGTRFIVKNLFYNVPARRKFLKSDQVEMRHIIEEFQRVALIHPDIGFRLMKDGNELFDLRPGSHRQRIVGVMGTAYDQRLVPVEEHTELVNVSGFIGKPEFARKRRGEQYLFLNQRFIKSPYLHNAICKAYDELLPAGAHPSYFLHLMVDPAKVDINIHPTKTEVKFEDERSIYAIVSSAIRQSLGRFNIAPSLDFEHETGFDVPPLSQGQAIRIPDIQVDPDFNPFETSPSKTQQRDREYSYSNRSSNKGSWEQLYEVGRLLEKEDKSITESVERADADVVPEEEEESIQVSSPKGAWVHPLGSRYLLTSVLSGALVIDIQRAHERILYERFIHSLALQGGQSQQMLFPQTLELSAKQMESMLVHADDLKHLGFDLEPFGPRSIKVNGVPAEEHITDAVEHLRDWVDDLGDDVTGKSPGQELAKGMARRMRYSGGHVLQEMEMRDLVDRLFACEQPYHCPSGHPTVMNIDIEDLDRKFGHSI